jgi:hypothetical protein
MANRILEKPLPEIPKKVPSSDYLKYYRVIKYYIGVRYNISEHDIDLLLFLYSEKYFTKKEVVLFQKIMPWESQRFSRLITEGWIDAFRPGSQGRTAIYQISMKGTIMLRTMYQYIEGREVPEDYKINPLFRQRITFTDSVYREMIMVMNRGLKNTQRKNTKRVKKPKLIGPKRNVKLMQPHQVPIEKKPKKGQTTTTMSRSETIV